MKTGFSGLRFLAGDFEIDGKGSGTGFLLLPLRGRVKAAWDGLEGRGRPAARRFTTRQFVEPPITTFDALSTNNERGIDAKREPTMMRDKQVV